MQINKLTEGRTATVPITRPLLKYGRLKTVAKIAVELSKNFTKSKEVSLLARYTVGSIQQV